MSRDMQFNWIEVRPLLSGKFDVGNFSRILDYLHNTGRPFRFFAANCPSTRIEGMRAVRIFIQLEDREVAERLSNFLRSSLDVEVIIGSAPPAKIYPYCVEFALKGYGSQPICDHKQKPEANPIDALIGVLATSDAAFEVLAIGDKKARRESLNYISKKMGKSTSFLGILADQVLAILDAIVGAPPPKKTAAKDLDPFTKIRVEAASWKASQNLFRCEVKAYGDQKAVEAISEALPSSSLNRFRVLRRTRSVVAPKKEIQAPKGREFKTSLLKYAALIPLSLFFVAWLLLGVIDPLRLANIDLFAIALTLVSSVMLWALFKAPEPLILSTSELSLIVGLPTAIGKLPVEMGITRLTRDQLVYTPPLIPEWKAEGTIEPQEKIRKLEVKVFTGEPFRITDILVDPRTSLPLPNKPFEIYDEKGRRVYSGITDEKGALEVVYVAEKPGSMNLEVRAEGYMTPLLIIEILAENGSTTP